MVWANLLLYIFIIHVSSSIKWEIYPDQKALYIPETDLMYGFCSSKDLDPSPIFLNEFNLTKWDCSLGVFDKALISGAVDPSR